jgi:hypothetical protein
MRIKVMKQLTIAICMLTIMLSGFNSVEVHGATLKKFPSGLVLRGKAPGATSFCDLPRGEVDGGYCQIRWSDLEPVKGQFNYSLIDTAIQNARAYNSRNGISNNKGYKVLIRIRAGVHAPQWVKDRVGSIPWHFKNTTANQTHELPLFWQGRYKTDYRNMMAALANRYDNNISVGAVSAAMCMTFHTEIMWNRTGRSEVRATNIARMRNATNSAGRSMPYTNAKDFKCLQDQVNAHAVWQKTPTLFASHLYQEYDYSTGNASTSYNKAIQLFNFCRAQIGDRCVLGNNSLLHTEKATGGNIYQALTQVGEPLYFQTHVFSNSGNKTFNFSNLKTAIRVGANFGGSIIELPIGWDCGNIYNKTNCTAALADSRSAELANGRTLVKRNAYN